ncbi:septal ring lytic transglycosylase RlpA family protein [Methylobacterium durans]|uniref:Endolytic peptidoglycan transglycosylase RlpA n=1 Tax=Methylobacterium durans TaxID=2202825 RepID=A0A2U8WCY7_9HYPH|nr:septal ring lytic transglycosylase RlpA family lipoprotein [Methylobacterium durans]
MISNARLMLLAIVAITCSTGAHAEAAPSAPAQSGVASWYGPGFHGRRTANGERFNTHALTAAHRSLPFGTQVRVTNKSNGRSVVVRINDRGPFVGGRVIDLSNASARAIGVSGVAKVSLARL